MARAFTRTDVGDIVVNGKNVRLSAAQKDAKAAEWTAQAPAREQQDVSDAREMRLQAEERQLLREQAEARLQDRGDT